MKTTLHFLSILILSTTLHAQLPGIEWEHSLGGSNFDQATGVTQSPDGNYIAVGVTKSSDGDVTTAYGGYDIWMVKQDETGAILWEYTFGGSAEDVVESVSFTDDGGFVIIGYTKSIDQDFSDNDSTNPMHQRIFCAKFTTNGILDWKQYLGPLNGGNGRGIEPTSDGGFICISQAYFFPDNNPNLGSYDAVVTKLDSNATIEWEQTFGSSGADSGWRITENASGDFIFLGSTIWGHNNLLTNHGSTDLWLVSVASDGTMNWQKNFGGPSFETAKNLLALEDGGYLILGTNQAVGGDVSQNYGAEDVWIIKTDADGNLEWESSYGGLGVDDARAIYPTATGFIIGGSSPSGFINGTAVSGYGNRDFWVMGIDDLGSVLWNVKYGGSDNDYLYDFFQTMDGGYMMGGWTYSNDNQVSFNHSENQADYWIVKLNDGSLSAPIFDTNITLQIVPNPGSDTVHFSQEIDSLEIYSSTGAFIASYATSMNTLDTHLLSSGIYLFKFSIQGKQGITKFVKI